MPFSWSMAQEILNYGRQSIPTYRPGHRLNSGSFGTMGVGVPFGVGAKVGQPDKQVMVLHGDGSFGMNAMEMDTAVRHNIPIVTVISLNGGWTADPEGNKVGRTLGYQRYEKMMDAFGGHGEYVEKPSGIRPALERAYASGKPAIVNVKTDFRARATDAAFYGLHDLVERWTMSGEWHGRVKITNATVPRSETGRLHGRAHGDFHTPIEGAELGGRVGESRFRLAAPFRVDPGGRNTTGDQIITYGLRPTLRKRQVV